MTTSRETDASAIRRMLAARHPLVAVSTTEEQYVMGQVVEAMVDADPPLLAWTISKGLYDGRFAFGEGDDVRSLEKTDHPAAALYHLARRQEQPTVAVLFDVAGSLDDERTLRLLREAIAACRAGGGTLILIDHRTDLPAVIESEAVRLEVSLPDEDELERIVRSTVRAAHQHARVEVEITVGQLRAVVSNLRGLTRLQAERVILDVVADDRRFDASDIGRVMTLKREAIAAGDRGRLLEFVEAPEDLSDIGGLAALKAWLAARRRGFDDRASEFGLRPPRGVLLLGVQGAGKSLCAKAVAAAWHLPLLRMDPGALYDRFVGESERRLREALHQTERMAPVVLWIDEIEKGFASAASQSTDGGLSQRMFGTLLSWMQEHRSAVFLFATANNIDALPPELLRKGRFDEIFFVDLPGEAARRQILEIHLRRRRQEPADFDLDRLVAASADRSGAEIEEAIVGAMHEAFADGFDANLTTEHVLHALESSPPLAVTMAERIDALRRWAQGRCVPAD